MADFRIYSPDLERAKQEFAAAASRIEAELQKATALGVRLTADEIRARTPVRSGRLRAAIRTRVDTGQQETIGVVEVDPSVTYADAVEEGTRPHTIRPVNVSALCFMVGGQVVFAKEVHHPGTAGAHMFALGGEAARPYVERAYEDAMDRVLSHLATGR